MARPGRGWRSPAPCVAVGGEVRRGREDRARDHDQQEDRPPAGVAERLDRLCPAERRDVGQGVVPDVADAAQQEGATEDARPRCPGRPGRTP